MLKCDRFRKAVDVGGFSMVLIAVSRWRQMAWVAESISDATARSLSKKIDRKLNKMSEKANVMASDITCDDSVTQ